MVVALICVAWLSFGLPVAVVLGRALHHAEVADRGAPVADAHPRTGLRPAARWLAAG
ncbi:hypothetical protein ACI796_16070 [Geodermatophilus sp. SYSU D00525]